MKEIKKKSTYIVAICTYTSKWNAGIGISIQEI